MDVCIKNIGEDYWRSFKSESVKHGLKMGDFFNKLIVEHQKKCENSNWDKVLYGKKVLKGVLTREDFISIKKEFREGFRMREG